MNNATDDLLEAAQEHLNSIAARADGYSNQCPLFHGWAVRDAFIAGANWDRANIIECLRNHFDGE